MYRTINARLLTTVSVIALLGSFGNAMADADNRPILWIEAGGQFEQLSDKQEPYDPAFATEVLANPFKSPIALQAPPRFSVGEEASIIFQPRDSDWMFSAAIHFGRANRNGNSHQETIPASAERIVSLPALGVHATQLIPPFAGRFATTVSQIHDSNLILDFDAGKDVGLGIGNSSTLSAGIRYVQFSSRSSANLDADPDFAFSYKYLQDPFGYTGYIKGVNESWDIYAGKMNVSRRFSGLGPSLRWEGNAVVAGNDQAGEITFDWGLNGAVLFGRQKMRAHEQTTARHGFPNSHPPLPLNYQTSHDTARSRSVTVPNAGGFVGLSLRYPNAKISLGYRIDYYINAMDGGLLTRKSENRGFYGPFASISIGIGD